MSLGRLVKRGIHEGLRWLPARWYLPLFFKRLHGSRLSLKHPTTFNEKIQWLKLHYRDARLPRLADKWEARTYVATTVGEHYLNPAIGVYDRPADIPFASLPARFAVKATHGSGWNVICRDKATIDWPAACRQLETWLGWNHYWMGREWAYKDIRPRLIVEHFLADDRGEPPADYKIFCTSGRPRAIQVDLDRFTQHTRSLFDPTWQKLPCSLKYPIHVGEILRPSNLDEMLAIASKLAADFPFVRVDLYDVAGRIVFGEMTFYPGSGVERFDPPEYDKQFGSWIELPGR